SEEAAKNAVKRALDLLETFQHSELYHQLEQAPAVYREMPFIYETNRFIVHGIIDVVFRQPDGTWVLTDYKTSSVFVSASSKRMNPTPEMLEAHARRYHLQVGIYARAVQEQLGIIPETRIHY